MARLLWGNSIISMLCMSLRWNHDPPIMRLDPKQKSINHFVVLFTVTITTSPILPVRGYSQSHGRQKLNWSLPGPRTRFLSWKTSMPPSGSCRKASSSASSASFVGTYSDAVSRSPMIIRHGPAMHCRLSGSKIWDGLMSCDYNQGNSRLSHWTTWCPTIKRFIFQSLFPRHWVIEPLGVQLC